MADESGIVDSLPDRPLKQAERFAFARHDSFESVIPHDVREGEESDEEVMYGAVFVGQGWVTAVNYVEGTGWEVVYKDSMDDDPTEGGVLDTSSLDEGHPLREGMQALTAARDTSDD